MQLQILLSTTFLCMCSSITHKYSFQKQHVHQIFLTLLMLNYQLALSNYTNQALLYLPEQVWQINNSKRPLPTWSEIPDLLWWVFYDPLHSTLVSLYRGPLANLWHPIQQATKELIRAPLSGRPRKVLIWYLQGIPEPQQCIHTALCTLGLALCSRPSLYAGLGSALELARGKPTRLLSCYRSQKPDANGILMGLKHCTYWREEPVI